MAPSQSNARPLMHKNQLQEYAQKSALPLPSYHTVNEGYPHAAKFRSTVLVNKTTYTSKSTFPNRKSAEQDVAKLAFDCIASNLGQEGCPLIEQDPLSSKSILHEFAVKRNLTFPKYTTTCPEGPGVVFVCSLVFDGRTYIGEVAGSKKFAEQQAAHSTIHSLLGSHWGNLLREIIKSKGKLAAWRKDPGFNQRISSNVQSEIHPAPPSIPVRRSEINLPRPGIPVRHSEITLPRPGIPVRHSEITLPRPGVPVRHSEIILPRPSMPVRHFETSPCPSTPPSRVPMSSSGGPCRGGKRRLNAENLDVKKMRTFDLYI